MDGKEIVATADIVPGWMTEAELLALIRMAAELPAPATWLEIGVWCGRSALAVGLALPQGSTLHLVDRYRDYPRWYDNHRPSDEWPKATALKTIKLLRVRRPDLTVRLWEIDSRDMPRHIPARSCDVAFIDGDHSRDAVTSDCRACDQLIKSGGIVCGHDYGPRNLEVIDAVHTHYQGRERVITGTTIWVSDGNPNMDLAPARTRRTAEPDGQPRP